MNRPQGVHSSANNIPFSVLSGRTATASSAPAADRTAATQSAVKAVKNTPAPLAPRGTIVSLQGLLADDRVAENIGKFPDSPDLLHLRQSLDISTQACDNINAVIDGVPKDSDEKLVLAAIDYFSGQNPDPAACPLKGWSAQQQHRIDEQLDKFQQYLLGRLKDSPGTPSITQMDARSFWDARNDIPRYQDDLENGYSVGYLLVRDVLRRQNTPALIKVLMGAWSAKRAGQFDVSDFSGSGGKAPLQNWSVWDALDKAPKCLDLLLAADVLEINPTEGGRTPLQVLCQYKPREISGLMKSLLAAGADPNGLGAPVRSNLPPDDYAPLALVACWKNGWGSWDSWEKTQLDCMKQLLRAGADLNEGGFGVTPLNRACEWARTTKSIELLLEYGADPNKPDAKGSTPLDLLLCKNGCPAGLEKLDTLLRHSTVSPGPSCTEAERIDRRYTRPEGGVLVPSAVLTALEGGRRPELERLLEEPGIDLNFCNSRNQFSPLLWAAHDYMMHMEMKHSREQTDEALSVVRALISRGAKIRYWHKGRVKDYKYDLERYIAEHCNARWHQPSDELRPLSQLFQEYGPEQPVQPAQRCSIQ